MNAVRLTAEDLEQIKKDAIAKYPGVWLHHYGHMIEEEVLRRNGFSFVRTEARLPGTPHPVPPKVMFTPPLCETMSAFELRAKQREWDRFSASRKAVLQ